LNVVADDLTQTDRFVSTVLLGIMILLGISGVVMLYGAWWPWIYDLHRAAGFSLIALIPFKTTTIFRSLLLAEARSTEGSLRRFAGSRGIEVLDDPLEVVSGILCTPLQVFRDSEFPRASSDTQ
jgi:hypothetical protein